MAKKKSKGETKKPKKPDLSSQKTVSLLVPDKVGELHPDLLKSLAHVVAHATELSVGQPPHAAVQHLAIIKTSKVAEQISAFPMSWHKSIPDGC